MRLSGAGHRVHSWYGLTGEISTDSEFWHKVRGEGVPLPHPPLINLLLRRGLPHDERLRLSFLHEFGHLQTFPLALLHASVLFVLWVFNGRGRRMSYKRLIAGLIANHSAWELFSESYVIRKTGRENFEPALTRGNRMGRMLFWQGMMTLTAIASYIFMRGKNPHSNRDK